MKKVLLVTDVPPSKKYSGSLLTWHLCKNFVAETLCGYFMVAPTLEVKPEYPFAGTPEFIQIKKSQEYRFRPKYVPRMANMFASFSRELYRKYIQVPRYAKNVIAFAKKNDVEKIWIILQGQTLVWLAEYLIRKNKYPVHAQVWDSASWWATANELDRFSRKMLMKSYEYCIANCDEFGSPSFKMSEIVQEKYSRESFPLIGISPVGCRQEARMPSPEKEKWIVGIAGQLYANDTIKSFIEALDSVHWEIEGKKLEIHFWGSSASGINRRRMVFKGYVSQELLLEALSTCDVLYCPYWFDNQYAEESKTSFPSKIVSYLNSGVPVLFHGAEDSSPGTLLNRKNAAVCCHSLDSEVILYNLRKALFSNELPVIQKNASQLVKEELSESYTAQNFRKFLKLGSEGVVENTSNQLS